MDRRTEIGPDPESVDPNHFYPVHAFITQSPSRDEANAQTSFHPGFHRLGRVEFHNDVKIAKG